MNPSTRANQLIEELLDDPRHFATSGGGYELLQTYLQGAPLDTLRPLLRSRDILVQREAAFVLSELGVQAFDLLDDALPLIYSGDRSVSFDAMEIVAVCATGARAPEFLHVVAKLEDSDEILRSLSMFLMANVEVSKIEAVARAAVERGLSSEHQHGLRLLLDVSAPDEAVLGMIHSDKPLNRRYGAVAAARLYEASRRLIAEAEVMEDGDVTSFVKSFLKSRGVRSDTTE